VNPATALPAIAIPRRVPSDQAPRSPEPARFRLLHRGVIVGIDGPSYRMRAHQQRADVIRKAVTAAGTSR
jgi:hypothetical protein